MFKDEYFDNVWYHISCINTEKGKKWREEKVRTDAGYARYFNLISHGRIIKCKVCGAENRLYLKAAQMTPHIWEMNCIQCHNVNYQAIDAYTRYGDDLAKELQSMKKEYLCSSEKEVLDRINTRIDFLASQYDDFGKCECGGFFSIKAKPRCKECDCIISDSFFHYVE